MPKSPEVVTLHGVFVSVLGLGVLLSGKSGIGKSELGLGLIDRGHQLVSDDSVNFSLQRGELFGKAPPVLQDFLEVRGLGILNIRAMFGDGAIKVKKKLQLIINIIQVSQKDLYKIDRLNGMHDSQTIQGLVIPQVSIPVAPGRNLAILVESAVKNHQLRAKGYNSNQDFSDRHQRVMQENEHGS